MWFGKDGSVRDVYRLGKGSVQFFDYTVRGVLTEFRSEFDRWADRRATEKELLDFHFSTSKGNR